MVLHLTCQALGACYTAVVVVLQRERWPQTSKYKGQFLIWSFISVVTWGKSFAGGEPLFPVRKRGVVMCQALSSGCNLIYQCIFCIPAIEQSFCENRGCPVHQCIPKYLEQGLPHIVGAHTY